MVSNSPRNCGDGVSVRAIWFNCCNCAAIAKEIESEGARKGQVVNETSQNASGSVTCILRVAVTSTLLAYINKP